MEKEKITVSYDTGENLLQRLFQEYQSSRFMEKLNDKYAPRPYYVQHKYTRLLAMVASYIFNVFSAVTAGVLIYLLGEEMIGNEIIAAALAFVFLILLEISKRIISSDIWQCYFQFDGKISWNVMLLIGLLTLSIGCSFYGGKKLIKKYSAQFEAPLRPEIINSLEHRITELETQIKDAGENKYRDGRTTIESRETILLLTTQIGEIGKEKLAYEKAYFEEVDLAKSAHWNRIESKAFYFALATLFFETCFMICVWYLEYFDWRSWSEFQAVNRLCTDDILNTNSARPKGTSTNTGNFSSQNQDVKYLKSRIATAKYRLKKGIGNKETNEQNLEKYESLLLKLVVSL